MLFDITNRVCTINDAVDTGQNQGQTFDNVFSPAGRPTSFVLSARSSNGTFPEFQATYVGDDPPPFWCRPINLVSRGNKGPTLAPDTSPQLLPPWQNASGTFPLRQQYLDALGTLLSWADGHPSFLRLEGDVLINDRVESIVLYFFAAGVVNDRDFVLVEVLSDQDETSARESGIAHGNF